MSADLCNEPYTRPVRQGEEVPQLLLCQYITGHPTHRHSWFAIQVQDQHDQAAAAQRSSAAMGEQELLEHIEAGLYDSILEALLNAAHNRKRTLRGLRGFPLLERRSNGRQR